VGLAKFGYWFKRAIKKFWDSLYVVDRPCCPNKETLQLFASKSNEFGEKKSQKIFKSFHNPYFFLLLSGKNLSQNKTLSKDI
jgi:hypothetical protein